MCCFNSALIRFRNGVCICDKCRSLGCMYSSHFVPVKYWKCYPKNMENVL